MSNQIPKFHVGDIVLFHDGLFRVVKVNSWDPVGGYFTYDIGTIKCVAENQIQKADWRDKTRILSKRNNNI